jgi:hypothetical protein
MIINLPTIAMQLGAEPDQFVELPSVTVQVLVELPSIVKPKLQL